MITMMDEFLVIFVIFVTVFHSFVTFCHLALVTVSSILCFMLCGDDDNYDDKLSDKKPSLEDNPPGSNFSFSPFVRP